jgi:hypothetical protein
LNQKRDVDTRTAQLFVWPLRERNFSTTSALTRIVMMQRQRKRNCSSRAIVVVVALVLDGLQEDENSGKVEG